MEVLMSKRLTPRNTTLLSVPSALITYRSAAGVVQVAAATWVGITCTGSPVLSVGLKGRECPLERLGPEGIFAVNLPAAEGCFAQPFMEYSGCPDSSFNLIEGNLSRVPLIAECQIQIECRRGRVSSSFEREILKGEVMIVHRDGITLDHLRAADLCRLNPFADSRNGYSDAPSSNIPT
jgi:flavin reductase (DIM6/NTAB) family NADH-FMN oxidoreductase RutF